MRPHEPLRATLRSNKARTPAHAKLNVHHAALRIRAHPSVSERSRKPSHAIVICANERRSANARDSTGNRNLCDLI
eukprot:4818394-Pleurochrysis_carterae.AAC.1